MANNPNQSSTFTAIDIIPVIPNDTIDLAVNARAIRATTAGTLRINTVQGVVRNTRIGADEVLMVSASRIHATGTSATGLEVFI